MKHLLIITGKINAGDYINSTETVELEGNIFKGWDSDLEEKQITVKQFFEELAHAIKLSTKGYNWEAGGDKEGAISRLVDALGISDIEDIHEAIGDRLYDFMPYYDHGVHTIESIEYVPIGEKVKLL